MINPTVFAVLIFFLFFPSLVVARPTGSDGDAIVVASLGDARTLIPILASDTSSSEICHFLFNGLVKYDENLELTGDLASHWEISDNGLTITFYLRKNVRWHDGQEFTARDVEFTFLSLINPSVRTPYSSDFLKVKSFKILDLYTIEVTYSEPFSPGLASWGVWIMPRHILEGQDLNTCDFSNHPVGTGPYKFKRWKKQEMMELVVNRDYFEGQARISRYLNRVIPDSSTLFLELQTRGVDYASLSPLPYVRQTDNSFFRKYYHKYKTPGFGYTYLGYNLKNDLFRDKRVRQALNYAVNKKEIIAVNLLGLGEYTTGPFLPGSWAYNRNVEVTEFNPNKAIALLKEAGWQNVNHDGFLEKDGRLFEFTILTNQGNELRIKTAELIQKYFKDIGIKAKIKVLEWSSLLSQFIDQRKFDVVLLGWALPRDPDCFDIWHSSKQKEGEFNFLSFENQEVDLLLEKARRTFDVSERARCYQRIQEILYDEQPCMFLFVPQTLEILSSRFRGVVPALSGIGYNFIDWFVPSEEQKYRAEIDYHAYLFNKTPYGVNPYIFRDHFFKFFCYSSGAGKARGTHE